MTDEEYVKDFLVEFGETCARWQFTLEETIAFFDEMLREAELHKNQGCDCKMQLLIDMEHQLFRFDHYPECKLSRE